MTEEIAWTLLSSFAQGLPATAMKTAQVGALS
jgi:hypothetical protein